MGTIEEEISILSNEELAERLRSVGESFGPITSTTRSQYERKLKRRLVLQSAATCTISYSLSSQGQSASNDSSDQKPPDAATKDDKDPDVSSDDAQGQFYGVCLPPNAPSTGKRVFTKAEDALRLSKEIPGSRFNRFSSRAEAELFSRAANAPNKTPLPKVEPSRPVPSEGSAFKAPRLQDLTILRKAIENGDIGTVRSLIWSNPRYLIGSGDNPTILQEGFRYNALHVCARSNQPEAAKLILDTIENPEFMKLMYPDDSEESRWSRINNLSDMYINTPDKGVNDTPLHFACKFGHIDVVGVLIKHPKINICATNNLNETPRDVVCCRLNKASSDLKNRFYRMLESQYYVPLLRSDGNTCPAKVEKPWCPTELAAELGSGSLPNNIPSFARAKLSMANHSFGSPKDAPMFVRAYAGPMSPLEAKQFHKKWMMSPGGLSPKDLSKYANIRRSDMNKGLERIGRELAKEMHVPWSEFWDFLSESVDLRTDEGLRILEEHLLRKKDAVAVEVAKRREEELARKKNVEICDLMDRLHLSGHEIASTAKENATSSRQDVETDGRSHRQWNVSDDWEADADRLKESLAKTAKKADDESTDWEQKSDCSYYTAVDDLDLEYSECSDILDDTWVAETQHEPIRVFVMGEEPCKTDADVLRAIEGVNITSDKYPIVHQWRTDVLSYPEEVRNRWTKFGQKAPHQQQHQLHSTPLSSDSTQARRLCFDDDDDSSERSPIGCNNSSSSNSSSPSSPPQLTLRNRPTACVNLFSHGSFA